MIFFITVLRALAACIITNSHYQGIYPLDILANGGLLGDVVFFAVSGFCLANVSKSFFSWYRKRIVRIYIPVAIITVTFLIVAQFYEPISVYYNFDVSPFFLHYFIYPTEFHFVGSIILLYIPFYFVAKYVKTLKQTLTLVFGLTVAYILIYVLAFDKTYYHIDVVREPFIRFLFFYAMLIGLFFRRFQEKYINKFKLWMPIAAVALFFAYFASKFTFAKFKNFLLLQNFQIFNQIILLLFLFVLFTLFISIDAKLECIPQLIKKIIGFIAGITLEIYLVQTPIIIFVRSLDIFFPLNWLVVTLSILLGAVILNKISGFVISLESICFEKAVKLFNTKRK